MTAKKTLHQPADALLHDLRHLIEETRSTVATTVNATLTMLYWRVGSRINGEVLQRERATYGAEILPTLSAKLAREYGSNFSEKNLRHMMRFAEMFQDEQIVSTLWRQLSWSHFLSFIPLKKHLLSHAKPRSREEKKESQNSRSLRLRVRQL
ncbi:MAG: DUF1016 N-terminal domain-containing protein [Pseudomonadota bacterium]